MGKVSGRGVTGRVVLGGLFGVLLSGPLQADPIMDALSGGQVSANVRVRYEGASDDSARRDVDALTVRTRVGYLTGDYRGFKLFGEVEDVTALVDDYADGPGANPPNGNTADAVIVDPDDTEINQFFLSYGGFDQTLIKLGRQRLILDNARFIGNVGWRQNEQTFDAISLVNTALPETKLTYAYLAEAQRIFSDEAACVVSVPQSACGDSEMESHLFNASYSGFDFGTLTAYAYLLGFSDTTPGAIGPAAGSQTFGVRFTGGTPLSEGVKLLYTFEYADQSDYDDGASTIDAAYGLAELGLSVAGITGKVGYERLEGDGTYGFSTPLATAHAFQGWADRFLGTPASGIEDTYFTLTSGVAGVKLLATYHQFESDSGNFDYGDELDLLAVKSFGKHYAVGLKYADYDADVNAGNAAGLPATSTEKVWLWFEMKFS
ncbi:MAG: alginate export family protein [Gammaproteobacteria bacterium]|nr:alginate export family protein [Gammaproteobacteria bacterium]